jgi:hypothetical protein
VKVQYLRLAPLPGSIVVVTALERISRACLLPPPSDGPPFFHALRDLITD